VGGKGADTGRRYREPLPGADTRTGNNEWTGSLFFNRTFAVMQKSRLSTLALTINRIAFKNMKNNVYLTYPIQYE
jgi:hypothetical protein